MKNLFSALIKAREEIKNLCPDKQGYGYKYVELSKIIDMLKNVLPKFGLGYSQLPTSQDPNNCGLRTIVFHESGESIEDTIMFTPTDMKGVNKSQALGASLTYFRRYALCAAFGITGDEDTDAVVEPKKPQANAAQPKSQPVQQAQPAQPKNQTAPPQQASKDELKAKLKTLAESGVFTAEDIKMYQGRLKNEDWSVVLSDMEEAKKLKESK